MTNGLLKILERYREYGLKLKKIWEEKEDLEKVGCWAHYIKGIERGMEEVELLNKWERCLGKTRDQVVRMVGEPDDKGCTSRKYRTPGIYKYGDIELHFEPWKMGNCFLVFDNFRHQKITGIDLK